MKQEMFVKHYAPLSAMLSGLYGQLNEICMDRNDSWFVAVLRLWPLKCEDKVCYDRHDLWLYGLKIQSHQLVTRNLNVKFEGHGCRHCQVITRQVFFVQGHCDLDFWPDDPLNHKGSSTSQMQLQVKFEGHGCRHCWVITRTTFYHSRSLWPWPLARWPPKTIGVIYWSGPTSISSLMTIGLGIVELSLGQALKLFYH